jgi:hypothetical protein
LKIIKSGSAEPGGVSPSDELAAVNAFAKTSLSAEDVYIFPVLLCDNEVDRDFERFTEDTLRELGELFTGKTGICDHEWKSGNQVARIYRTELLTDESRKNSLGLTYTYLKGWAYMLRTQDNEELIAQIEGGIKKETSVGCSVAGTICSICGSELGSAECGHIKGRMYGDRLCYGELTGAVDAYEWSFVAVPSQKNAGVIKKYDLQKGLKGFVESGEGAPFAPEFGELEKSAAIGRKYIKALRDETLRLSLVCGKEWYDAVKGPAQSMDEAELAALMAALQKRADSLCPPATQLPGRDAVTAFDGSDYKI